MNRIEALQRLITHLQAMLALETAMSATRPPDVAGGAPADEADAIRRGDLPAYFELADARLADARSRRRAEGIALGGLPADYDAREQRACRRRLLA